MYTRNTICRSQAYDGEKSDSQDAERIERPLKQLGGSGYDLGDFPDTVYIYIALSAGEKCTSRRMSRTNRQVCGRMILSIMQLLRGKLGVWRGVGDGCACTFHVP